MSQKELQALREILDLIVPSFNILGYNKPKFINRLVKEASKDGNITSLQLRTIYLRLRRVYT